MASITVEARNEILAVLVGMFDAAPGSAILSVLVEATEAGASLNSLAAALATKPQFEQVYPANNTASEFADKLIDTLLGNEVTAQQKASAHDLIVSKLNAGEARSDVIVDAVQLLLAATGEKWADAQAALLNKVAVSSYYSVDAQQSSNSLADLQAVLANVTSDPASVDAAIEDIDNGVTTDPQYLTTASLEKLVGGTSNDVFIAPNDDGKGNAATTLNASDTINGGDGRDTLKIYTDGTENAAISASTIIKNVEVINIVASNAGGVAALADVSLYDGIEALWQQDNAAAVTNLTNDVTAGFKDIAAASALAASLTATATTANVALAGVDATATLAVNGAKLDTLNISGALANAGSLATAVTLGAAVKTATVNSEVDATLTFTGAALTSVDASGSTGDIIYDATAAPAVASITGGSGDDTLTIATATTATVNAVLDSGDGDDSITVNTTGAGNTTINAGAGDDTVNITASAGILTLDLGAGDDTFNAAVGGVTADDTVDGGAGTDTLQLNLVGVANIGAFSNFEVFDAIGLAAGKNLDVDILAQNNTVTEIVTTGDVGAGSSLSNLGAGVGYRIIGDDTAGALGNALTLNQKTAGALSIALDIDESGTTAATTALLDTAGAVAASNATSIAASFDSDFVGKATGAGDNEAGLQITADAATSLTVASSGDNASNFLAYLDTNDKLTSVTVTGDSDVNVDLNNSSKVATVDASGLAGSLIFDLADLKAGTTATAFDGGVLKLGAGDDVITIANGAKVSGLALGEGEDAAAQDGFDVIVGANAQAADNVLDAFAHIEDGLVTFQGTGPNDLATAIAQVVTAAAGGAAVFEYIGNSYIVDGTDVIQLVGVTGLEGLDNVTGGTDLYVF